LPAGSGCARERAAVLARLHVGAHEAELGVRRVLDLAGALEETAGHREVGAIHLFSGLFK
jgi:hypothetical protein